MASKFLPGMKNVLEVLNQMWDAFAAGPYNALPLTGGKLTGLVESTSTIIAIRGAIGVNAGGVSGMWFRVAKLNALGSPSQASVRVLGTASYDTTGASNAMETVISLRYDNDGQIRGHFYSIGALPTNTVSAVRIGRDGSVYIKTNDFFTIEPYIDSSIAVHQIPEQAVPPVDAYEAPAIFGVKCGAESTFTVTPGAIVARATLTAGSVGPLVDNAHTLGSSALAYSTVYARTGTINTSDVRLKCYFRDLTSTEIAAARDIARAIGIYRWRDAVESKGEDAREHIGPTVQRAIEIMQAHGLDPFNYGFICYDEWEQQTVEHPAIEARPAVSAAEAVPAVLNTFGQIVAHAMPASPGFPAVEARAAYTEVTLEAGDRYAFRYDELAMFIAAGQEARLAALEAAQ
ncbi:tail fiber domain-containing protein [Janthinobacterium sp. HLX7-2]|uniref:tail fiber domain-containing protein n=1 Tax=Janthinobacterium sp. HLX7-2 TaxID=1259331 RepID=UPI003F21BBA5